MLKVDSQKLMQDKRIIREINRYRWFESKKLGYDIGFERAADDWFVLYSLLWIRQHLAKHRRKPVARKNPR